MQKTKEQYFKEFEEKMERKMNGEDVSFELPDNVKKFIRELSEQAVIEEDEEEVIEDLDVIVARDVERKRKERELLAQEIVRQQQKEEREVLTKEDVQEILKIKDNGTVLRLFRVLVRNGYASKLGKSYIITKKNFEKFLKHIEGQDFDF